MQKSEVTNRQMADVLNWARDQGLISVNSTIVRNTEGNQQELLDLDDDECTARQAPPCGLRSK